MENDGRGASSGEAATSRESSPRTRTLDAVQELRRRILALEFLPGETLQERRLAEILGMSRSPIRAALAQLAGEGLARRSGHSYKVVKIDPAVLDEIFDYRIVLETAAVEMAAARGSLAIAPARLVLEQLATGDGTGPQLELSERFHLELARASGNRFIFNALASLFPQITHARFLEVASPARRRRAAEEHAEVLRLVEAGRGNDAAEAMRHHIKHTRRTFERGLARLGAGARLLAGEA